jgi:LPS-assembly lipoprotein
MGTHLRITFALALALLVAACGFHLRRSANLPPAMQQVHLAVSGSTDFKRELARAVAATGATVVDAPGPGIAELNVPQARFSTNALTITGQGRISEKAVRFHVEFDVTDDHGKTLVPHQDIDMSREYTYDARESIGQSTQAAAIRESLVQDMVSAIMFRLQALAEHPAAAGSAAAPARASTAG